MIDNRKNTISRGRGTAILLRNGRKGGSSLVLRCVTEEGGRSEGRQNLRHVTGELPYTVLKGFLRPPQNPY